MPPVKALSVEKRQNVVELSLFLILLLLSVISECFFKCWFILIIYAYFNFNYVYYV